MATRLFIAAPTLLLLLFLHGSAHATTVFSETFDAEPGSGDGLSGLSQEGYTSFAQWSVSDGSVDLVAQGDFAPAPSEIACVGGAGKCVDLDGNSMDAGVLTSTSIALAPGLYELSYALSGVASSFTVGNSTIPNEVDVSVGMFFATSHTIHKGDPFQTLGGQFTVASPTSVEIVFSNQGGDNFGAILDDVELRLVPEPGVAVLLGLGLAALGARRRSA